MGNYSRMQGAPDRALDPTPMEMPIGAKRPASLQDFIARMVRDAVIAEKGEEFETWEEADDFEEEDPDTLDFSKYELADIQDEADLSSYGVSEAPQETISPQPDPNAEGMKEQQPQTIEQTPRAAGAEQPPAPAGDSS